MSAYNAYNWQITATTNGKCELSAHGIKVGIYDSEKEAEEYIKWVVTRDVIERRARRWAERELTQWADRWSEEFSLPREEVWEDIQAGVTAMLIDAIPLEQKKEGGT
jgi:hypothetical protein